MGGSKLITQHCFESQIFIIIVKVAKYKVTEFLILRAQIFTINAENKVGLFRRQSDIEKN